MQPEKVEFVREWLALAQEDLMVAERALAADPPLMYPALFHSQQTIEKALKAYLAWHDQPFRKTHDLQELLSLCQAIDPGLGAVNQAARVLTRHAVETLYPRGIGKPARAEADEALRLARESLAFILDRLPDDVKP